MQSGSVGFNIPLGDDHNLQNSNKARFRNDKSHGIKFHHSTDAENSKLQPYMIITSYLQEQ